VVPKVTAVSADAVRRHLSAAVAAIERHRGPDDPEAAQLRAMLAIEGLAEHIARVVNAAPPLTAAQRDRLVLLLNPGAGYAT
jgi:hypothetical protein